MKDASLSERPGSGPGGPRSGKAGVCLVDGAALPAPHLQAANPLRRGRGEVEGRP